MVAGMGVQLGPFAATRAAAVQAKEPRLDVDYFAGFVAADLEVLEQGQVGSLSNPAGEHEARFSQGPCGGSGV